MSNQDVIKAFLEHKQAKTPLRKIAYTMSKGRTLYTENNNLINYNTTIATLKDNTLYLNTKKYSRTTSKIQTQIRNLATRKGLEIIDVD